MISNHYLKPKKIIILLNIFIFTTISLIISSCNIKSEDAFDKAFKYYENKLYEEAIAKFRIAIDQNIEPTRSYYYIGKSYDKLDQPRKAIQYFNFSIDSDPRFYENYIARGNIKVHLKKYKDAMSDFNKAIELILENKEIIDSLNLSSAYNNKGLIKRNFYKNFDASIEDFNRASEFRPNYFLPIYNRGRAKSEKGDYEGSIKDYSKAILFDPNNAKIYYERGRSKRRLKDFEGAINDFTKAIKFDSKQSVFYNDRGLIFAKLGKFNEAISDYDKAIASNKSAYSYNNRGFAKYKIGKYEEALLDCNISLKLDSTNSWVYYSLGLIAFEGGKQAEACDHLLKSKSMGMKEAEIEYDKKCKN